MINRITQLILIAFTVVFTLWIGTVFVSDRLYSLSLAADTGRISPEQGIAMLEAAMKLTPGDARLYAQKYDLMGQSAKRIARSGPDHVIPAKAGIHNTKINDQAAQNERSAPSAQRSADSSPDELTSSRAHDLKQGISSAPQSPNLRNLNESSTPDNLRNQKIDSIPVRSGRLTTDDRRPKPGDLLFEQQLQVIAHCVDLCPSMAGYHFQYALNMRKVLPRMTIQATQYLLSEFKKAYELKPCSAAYRSMYEKYEVRYGAGK